MSIKITAVRTADRMYDTEPPETNIKEIIYKREGALYNKGFQTGVPGYVIKLTNDDSHLILVPEDAVVEIIVAKCDDNDNVDTIPELPLAE